MKAPICIWARKALHFRSRGPAWAERMRDYDRKNPSEAAKRKAEHGAMMQEAIQEMTRLLEAKPAKLNVREVFYRAWLREGDRHHTRSDPDRPNGQE